jgi:hypothetical protein
MITITHTPKELSYNRYTIVGDDFEELINDCIKRIRPQSKIYYEKELRIDLLKNKKSMIDVHAGVGISYIIILKK